MPRYVARGGITPEMRFIICCAICEHQETVKRASMAQAKQVFEDMGWVKRSDVGWICPYCPEEDADVCDNEG